MKIVHINNYYAPVGGTEVYLHRLFDALEARGVETVMITEEAPPGPAPRARRIYAIPGATTFPSTKAAAERVGAILRDENPDCVHMHTLANADVVRACAAKRPTVRTIHNHDDYSPGGIKYFPTTDRICDRAFGVACLPLGLIRHCNSRRPNVLLKSYRRTSAMIEADRAVSRIVVASAFVKACLLRNRFASDFIEVLPYFTPLPENASGPAQSGVVLFSGRLVTQKGVAPLLDAISMMKNRVRLVICGDGPALPAARAHAKRVGLADRVEFTGWLTAEEQARAYASAQVVVVPSIWPEPFGIVGIEAMSYGLPVVAFDNGGISEWLTDGETGYLVRSNEVATLAGKLDDLFDDYKTCRRMGQNGRTATERLFAEAVHIQALLKIYRRSIDAFPT